MATIIGVCTIELQLEGVKSLKEKRSILKPMLDRLHKTFNISAAEVDQQDVWESAVIGVAAVTNSTRHANQIISNVLKWIEDNYPELPVLSEQIEIL